MIKERCFKSEICKKEEGEIKSLFFDYSKVINKHT